MQILRRIRRMEGAADQPHTTECQGCGCVDCQESDDENDEESTPLSPASGSTTISFNGHHPKANS